MIKNNIKVYWILAALAFKVSTSNGQNNQLNIAQESNDSLVNVAFGSINKKIY